MEGTCAENSLHIQGSLNVTCESSGLWNVSQFEGKCVCKEDMENVGGTCKGMFTEVAADVRSGLYRLGSNNFRKCQESDSHPGPPNCDH